MPPGGLRMRPSAGSGPPFSKASGLVIDFCTSVVRLVALKILIAVVLKPPVAVKVVMDGLDSSGAAEAPKAGEGETASTGGPDFAAAPPAAHPSATAATAKTARPRPPTNNMP